MRQIYNKTGKILRTVICSESQYQYQCTREEQMVAGEGSGGTHYIKNGVITLRSANTAIVDKTIITADGTDKAILSKLHNPSTVKVSGADEVVVTDGTLEITADSVFDLQVRCDTVSQLVKEFTINAT